MTRMLLMIARKMMVIRIKLFRTNTITSGNKSLHIEFPSFAWQFLLQPLLTQNLLYYISPTDDSSQRIWWDFWKCWQHDYEMVIISLVGWKIGRNLSPKILCANDIPRSEPISRASSWCKIWPLELRTFSITTQQALTPATKNVFKFKSQYILIFSREIGRMDEDQ